MKSTSYLHSHCKSASRAAALLGALLVVACGASDEGSPDEAVSPDAVPGESGTDPDTGMDRCASDPALQGPEPCVDEFGAILCRVNSGYPGDELAICQPGQDEGMLLHYGPDDYDDPVQVERFLLEAGGEDENCTFARTPNQTDVYTSAYRGRMRPNSHHLIVTTLDRDVEPNPIPGPCSTGDTVGSRWLVGSQDPQIDVAVGGSGIAGESTPEPGDPDYNLAQIIRPDTSVRIDMHYTNPTDQTILKEAWIYFSYYQDPSVVEDLVDMITFFQGEIDVAPQASWTTKTARCEAPTDRYVGLLTGHIHETGTRISVWHEKAAGDRVLVYETYDWADPGNLYYRDGIEIQSPNSEASIFGADHSGYLHLSQGEALSFECEFFNFRDETVTLGATSKDEMCNIFGMYYPTDGNVWNCACFGDTCVESVPENALNDLL